MTSGETGCVGRKNGETRCFLVQSWDQRKMLRIESIKLTLPFGPLINYGAKDPKDVRLLRIEKSNFTTL